MEKKCSAIQGMQKGREVNRFVSESDTTSHSFVRKTTPSSIAYRGGKVIPNVMGLPICCRLGSVGN